MHETGAMRQVRYETVEHLSSMAPAEATRCRVASVSRLALGVALRIAEPLRHDSSAACSSSETVQLLGGQTRIANVRLPR